ncbi:MAG: hypothetical protein AABZ15_11655 [Nitrospirota bacterium]
MKGRDKRRRVKSRKNEVPLERLRHCSGVMAALIDASTCTAEQRFQKSQAINCCDGCPHAAVDAATRPPLT